MLVYPIGKTDACQYAATELKANGIPLTDHPAPEVTHLLLDVPSFHQDGSLRGGGQIHSYLERLPPGVTVIGGSLQHPDLTEHRCLDLLQDADYTAINAAITADCALRVASREMKLVFFRCPVLILGWGRIGKCLGKMLKALGAEVTIAARKESDLAMIRALGYQAVSLSRLQTLGSKIRVVFNTVPVMVLEKDDFPSTVKIELASKPGMAGDDVIQAKGLPSIYAPESSGKLIAGTFLKLVRRG